MAEARILTASLSAQSNTDEEFIRRAFTRVLARLPKRDEIKLCGEFLGNESAMTAISDPLAPSRASQRVRENLVLVLFNHNDFVTVR
jgi:hypothetical protein